LGELKHSAALYDRLCDFLGVAHGHSRRTATQPQPASVWVNSSHPAQPSMEPDAATLQELARFYRPHNLRLFARLGREFDWHRASHYAYADTASEPPPE
jgi:hypothetical protein